MIIPDIRSDADPERWRGEMTMFPGAFNPLPSGEITDIRMLELECVLAAATQPTLLATKEDAPYFVPCRLQNAPLVGKTAKQAVARGLPTIGRMRSNSHTTEAGILVFDLDGLEQCQWGPILQRREVEGFALLAYTTHSHGRADKPGLRVRLVMLLDRHVNDADYRRVHGVLNRELLDGLADTTGAKLSQQQAVWVAHPDRAHMAWKVSRPGALVSVDKAFALAPVPVRRVVTPSRVAIPQNVTAQRVHSALSWWDPESYDPWHRALVCLKAIEATLPAGAARQLAMDFSERASDTAKAQNDKPQYDPGQMFDRLAPSMSADAAMGTLCGVARDAAVRVVVAHRGKSEWSPEGIRAVEYLNTHHPRTWAGLVGEACA